MQSIPRWRNLISLRKSSIPTLSNSTATTTKVAPATIDRASFHSAPFLSQKWKSKWNFTAKPAEQPTKNYIRYTTRQKRADAKKALKNLLFHTGNLKPPFQEDSMWNFDGSKGHDGPGKKKRSKVSPGRGRKPPQKKTKRWHRQESYSDDFETEKTFQATFGNRWYTWSFRDSPRFKNSSYGFEWREGSRWTSGRTEEWDESDDEISTLGSCSDRTTLGLPPTGPLKIDDVKTAFRTSALKWHPDKHQGPTQAMAEEKFKLCVNAYKSLCAAFT